jgi:hypothetical protein
MFAVEIPRIYFYARFSGLPQVSKRKAAATQVPGSRSGGTAPQEQIRDALADMLPSTAAEIAEATGLDPLTAAACLEALAAHCEVMFNPLTKRFSLPKMTPRAGLAA